MDKIYKTINIDNSRSHRNGLLPFVRFNGGKNIENVTALNTHGNYGNYVCDFGIFTEENGVKKEVTRLKYLDVLRWYRDTISNLDTSVYVKKIITYDSEIINIDCGSGNYSDAVVTKTEPERKIKMLPLNNMDNDIHRYNFTPLDIKYFKKKDMAYVFYEPDSYFEALSKEEDEITDDDITLISEVESFRNFLDTTTDTMFVLIENYDEIKDINDKWNKWWIENYKNNGWETNVFDGYVDNPYNEMFKFCYDVETYILGIKEVFGNNIKGEKVPSYVYYTTNFNDKLWFETRSANTMTAYNEPSTENKWMISEWEDNGGGDFYNFLSSFSPKWQKQKSVKNNENGRIFEYCCPSLDLSVILNSEYDYETLYDVYEYNVEKNKLVGAVREYSATSINDIVYVEYGIQSGTSASVYTNSFFFKDTIDTVEESGYTFYIINENSVKANGLTKQWVEFDRDTVLCESQLNTMKHPAALMVTDKIFGLYRVYDDKTPEKGQMFKCTYKEAFSKEPYIEIMYDVKEVMEDGTVGYTEVRDDIVIMDEVSPETDAYQIVAPNILSYSSTTITEEIDDMIIVSAITWTKYGWWDCKKVNDVIADKLVCADGENVDANNDKKYRNVTIVSCIDNMVGLKTCGDTYYIMSRFDNGNINPGNVTSIGEIHSLELPYKVDYPVNVATYDDGTLTMDIVTEIDESNASGGYVTIRYAKGVVNGANKNTSGVHYEEIYKYEKEKREIVSIDGVYLAELFYNKILIDDNKVEVGSREYGLIRETNRASITGMEVGTQWTNNGAVEALLITKEGSEGLYNEPKYSVDMLYNRGNAAAWENHFKLSECNTIDDLEKYGNNFFNL